MSAVAELPDTLREVLAGGKVKGGMMAAHLGFATGGRTPEQVARFRNALPVSVRESLRGLILPVNWYQFAHLIEIDRAIVRVHGGGNPSILREVGAHSAQLNLNGVYKVFRRESIHDFLEAGARLHPKFQDFGAAAYVRTSRSSGEMVHSGYCSFSPLFCESAFGYYKESLLLHGAKTVAVEEVSCQCRGDAACTFVLRWD